MRTASPQPRPTSRLRGEEGTALVEFALVLPIVLVLFLAAVTFTKAFNYFTDATHLAASAARYAAVDRNPGPGGTLAGSVAGQALNDELRSGGTEELPSGLTVCISYPEGTDVGDRVHVEVSFDYHFLPFLAGRMGLLSKTVTAQADMRLERPATLAAGCDVAS